jgi:hypothetical protein
MYDLILCVIATEKNNRLPIFQKIGYKKSNRYKVKIVYLADSKEKPDYLKEGDWFNCFEQMGNCFTSRFVEYIRRTNDEAKWFLQVDDDSCTDIDKTIDLLNYFYDHEDPVVLTGSFTYNLGMPRYVDRTEDAETCFCYRVDYKLQKVLKDMEIENLFVGVENLDEAKIIPFITRGWEHSVFSFGALKKIKKYERLEEYVSRCIEIDPDFSDQVPFVLAKIAKVPIAPCFFLTSAPSVEEYTAINKTGRFSHIHYICEPWDQLSDFQNLIENNMIFDNFKQINLHFDLKKENTDWLFFHIEEGKLKGRCLIKLIPENKIKIIRTKITQLISCCFVPEFDVNLNEKNYDLENKNWHFDNHNQNFSINNIIFNKTKDKLYAHRISDNSGYLLSKMHILDSVFWSKGHYIGRNFYRLN